MILIVFVLGQITMSRGLDIPSGHKQPVPSPRYGPNKSINFFFSDFNLDQMTLDEDRDTPYGH